MRSIKILISTVLILIIGLSSCNREQPPDPNSYYFRCKIDGQLFIPDNCANCQSSDVIGDTTLILHASGGLGSLGVGVKDSLKIRQTSYVLNELNRHRGSYDNSIFALDRYLTDSIHTGVLNITKFEKLARLIEGNFSFTAYNISLNKTVSVTEGKFRLRF